MIVNVELKDLTNIPLSQSTICNAEINAPVKIFYKLSKPGDIKV